MSDHSPTPWKIDEHSDCDTTAFTAANDDHVCIIQHEHDQGDDWNPREKANAMFLLRAVNNHEALLSVCNRALNILGVSSSGMQICQDLRAAIAAAEHERSQ